MSTPLTATTVTLPLLALLACPARPQGTAAPTCTLWQAASQVASPLFVDLDAATAGLTDQAVLLRQEVARQRLTGLRGADLATATLLTSLQPELATGAAQLEELRRRDASVPDIAGLVGRTVMASPALYRAWQSETLAAPDRPVVQDLAGKLLMEGVKLGWNTWCASEARDGVTASYRRSRRLGVDLEPTVAALHHDAKRLETDVVLDVDGSWNGWFRSDEIRFVNPTPHTLTNVFLFVEVVGWHGAGEERNRDRHLHCVERWGSGERHLACYLASSAGGMAKDQSVDQIDSVRWALFADGFRAEGRTQYTGAMHDADVAAWVDRMEFVGRWFRLENNLLYDDGMMFTRKDGARFPCSGITVTARRGEREVSRAWSFRSRLYPAGELQDHLFWSGDRHHGHPDFNRIDPEAIVVELSFPRSAHRHRLQFRR
jgi:hypothetical protein